MKRTRKIFALLLSICMIVTMLPTMAFAANMGGATLVTSIKFNGEEIATFSKEDNKIDSSAPLYSGNAETPILADDVGKKQFEITVSEKAKIKYEVNSSDVSASSGMVTGFGESDSEGKEGTISGTVSGLNATTKNVYFQVERAAGGTKEYFKVTLNIKEKPDEITGITLAAAEPAEQNKIKLTVSTDNSGATKYYYKACDSKPEAAIQYEDDPFVDSGYTGIAGGKPTGEKITAENGKYIEVYGLDGSNKVKSWGVSSDKTDDKFLAPPKFTEEKDGEVTVQMAKDSKAANFTLTEAPEGVTYKAYDQPTGGTEQNSKVTVTASGTAFTLTYKTAAPTEDEVFYIEANKAPDLVSARTKVTVKAYKSNDATLKELKVGDDDVLKNVTAYDSFEEAKAATPYEVEIPYGNNSTVNVTATKNDNDATVDSKTGTVAKKTEITGNALGSGVSVTYSKTDNKGTEVWIKVTAKDGSTNKFYHFIIKREAPETGHVITAATVNGFDASINSSYTNDGTTEAKAIEIVVDVPKGEDLNSVDVSFTVSKNAKIQGDAAASAPGSYDNDTSLSKSETGDIWTGTSIGLSSQNLYLEVSAEDPDVTQKTYYKVVLNETPYEIEELPTPSTEGVQIEDAKVKKIVEDSVKGTTLGSDDDTTTAVEQAVIDAAKAIVETIPETGEYAAPAEGTIWAMLKEKNPNINQGTINILAVPYLDITVDDSGYVVTDTEKKYTLDITPRYYVAATTATAVNDLKFDKGNTANAVKLTGETNKKDPELENLKNVKVDIKLPSGFATDEQVVKVKHTHSSKQVYQYFVKPTGGVVKFDNPHGFSEFELSIAKNATLDNLTVNEGTLTPAFNPETNQYTVNVPNSVDKITITPEANSTFTVGVSPARDESGKIPLTVGANTIVVTVTDNSTGLQQGTYIITVNREGATSGGSTGGTTSNHNVTVKTAENGTVTASAASNVAPNTEVTLTVKPAEGYVLDKLTVKADSGEITPTKVNDTTYTFKMPTADVTVTATFKLASEQKPEEDAVCAPYTDVDSSYAYHDQVHYMIENKLMTGVSNNTFGLNVVLNRAMVAQILYSKAEPTKPSYTVTKSFTDVKAGDWFANSVTWAESHGVTDGYGDGTFRPYNQVTREELVTMLYGEADQPDVAGNLSAYTDASSVSDWAVKAMTWAIENGVVTGTTATTLSPKNTTPRYQAAIMFYKYFTK